MSMKAIVTMSIPYEMIKQLDGMKINRSEAFRMLIRDIVEKKKIGTTIYEEFEKIKVENREYKKEILRLKRKVNKLLKLKGVA